MCELIIKAERLDSTLTDLMDTVDLSSTVRYSALRSCLRVSAARKN